MNASRMCLSGMAAAGLMAAVSAPAHATLQIAVDVNGSPFFCGDNMSCDTDKTIGTLQIGDQLLDGVLVHGSIQLSTGTPANPGPDLIDTSSLSIVNLSGATRTAEVAISDTDFSTPVRGFHLTGSGTWVGAAGSSLTLGWYDDPANAQGANLGPGGVPTTPGTLLGSFTTAGSNPFHSFSTDQTGLVSDTGPFSMTLWADGTLTPGAALLGRDQGEVKSFAIPEPSTWVLMALGFAGLGFVGFRQTRQSPRSLA
jgi:hypothetical protein